MTSKQNWKDANQENAALGGGYHGPRVAPAKDDEQQERGWTPPSNFLSHRPVLVCEDSSSTTGSSGTSTFPFDRDLLKIFIDEKHMALNVKDAIRRCPDIDMPSDFLLAHLGIAGRGDVDWALGRVKKMQQLRKQCKILGTYEEGTRALRAMMDYFPGTIMSFNYNPYTGKCLLIMDGVNNFEDAIKKPKAAEILARGNYYLCHACFPTLECVRVGNVHFWEMQGYSWVRGMSFAKAFTKLTNDSHGTFPSVVQEVCFFHTHAAAHMLLNMVKRFIPGEIGDRYKLGCKFAKGRLDKSYVVPTREEAFQRLYINLCGALKMRFESEKEFVLPSR